jgi:ATP-dependent DNA ligase
LLRHGAADVLATPPFYIAFDMMHRDGRDLRKPGEIRSANPP